MLNAILLFTWSASQIIGAIFLGVIFLFGAVYMPIYGIILMNKDEKAIKEFEKKQKEIEKEHERIEKSYRKGA